MLNKKNREKNKSKIYKQYHILTEQDGVDRDYWFSAQSEDHALEMFEEFASARSIKAKIISVEEE